jgi:hypothetical protein
VTGEPKAATKKTAIADLESFPKAGVAVVFGAGGGSGGALGEVLRSSGGFRHAVGCGRKSTPSIDLLDGASLSTRHGRIGDNRLGGWYSYRASEAALTQHVGTAAVELARQSPDGICIALHPGTVTTALSAAFAATGLIVHTLAEASHHLHTAVYTRSVEASGGFFDWRGQPVPW